MARKPQAPKSWQKAAQSRTGAAKPQAAPPAKALPKGKKGLVIVIGVGKPPKGKR